MNRQGNTLDDFFAAVRYSVEAKAKEKNYTDNGPDGENKMLVVTKALGIDIPHGVGEIIYKCGEYLKAPRRVILEKVAGWAFCVWREHPDALNSSQRLSSSEYAKKLMEGMGD